MAAVASIRDNGASTKQNWLSSTPSTTLYAPSLPKRVVLVINSFLTPAQHHGPLELGASVEALSGGAPSVASQVTPLVRS